MQKGAGGVVFQSDHINIRQEVTEAGFDVSLFPFITFKNQTALVLPVEDTKFALQNLASYWRDKNAFCVVGITGSQGKTTTKDFCLELFKSGGFRTKANPKSYNNVYGVSLSLLSAENDLDFFIQEMGTNSPGEMRTLSRIVRPEISVVVSVGKAHIGGFGTKEAIAGEKEQIYLSQPESPVKGAFNGDDPFTFKMYENFLRRSPDSQTLLFSRKNKKADVFLKISKDSLSGLYIEGHITGLQGRSFIPKVSGRVHLTNVLAAISLSCLAGLSAKKMWGILPRLTLPKGRNQWFKHQTGAGILFDAYNASPESVFALIAHLAKAGGEKKCGLILGDFLELGEYLTQFQNEIIEHIIEAPSIKWIWVIGGQAGEFESKFKQKKGIKAELLFSKEPDLKIVNDLSLSLGPEWVLALKASRKAKFEKLLKMFCPKENL